LPYAIIPTIPVLLTPDFWLLNIDILNIDIDKTVKVCKNLPL